MTDTTRVTDTTETMAFLADIADQYAEAERALHNGDAAPRMTLWSRTDPLTLFGAAESARGWDEIDPAFRWLGRTFTNCSSYRNEIVAAEARGDLAYLVALEHTTVSAHGAAPESYVLRVTTIFRREAGAWKIVHRHGDAITPLPSPGVLPAPRP
jgi:ketosteroid isomerase-like protein